MARITKTQADVIDQKIIKRMKDEKRSSRYMTEMQWEEFIKTASRMIADTIIKEGFSKIETKFELILFHAMDNEFFGRKSVS